MGVVPARGAAGRARRALAWVPQWLWWVLPSAVLLSLFKLYPTATVVRDSFTNKTSYTPGDFVGLDNYELLPDLPEFGTAVVNNLILCLSVPLTIVVALAISAVLFRGLAWSRFYELLIILPLLPAVASISVIFIYLFSLGGPLNSAAREIGVDALSRSWLTDPTFAIWAVLAVMSWKRIPLFVLLFNARLLSLDRAQFEAAAIEGAGWYTAFRRVAIPQMRSVIQFAAIIGFIEVFSYAFAFIFILTQGGPFKETYTLEFLLYQIQFSQQNVGLASAVAVILLLAVSLLAVYRALDARRQDRASYVRELTRA